KYREIKGQKPGKDAKLRRAADVSMLVLAESSTQSGESMKIVPSIRALAPAIVLGTLWFSPQTVSLRAQAAESATQSLLDKAHALEVRGRMDMAAQTWQQVLLADPVNVDALSGLARAAKLSGNTALANRYLDRLRAINPNDPNI